MTTQGLMGKGVPETAPKFLLFIKIAIIVLSVIVLALAAYATSVSYGTVGIGGLVIFVVCFSPRRYLPL